MVRSRLRRQSRLWPTAYGQHQAHPACQRQTPPQSGSCRSVVRWEWLVVLFQKGKPRPKQNVVRWYGMGWSGVGGVGWVGWDARSRRILGSNIPHLVGCQNHGCLDKKQSPSTTLPPFPSSIQRDLADPACVCEHSCACACLCSNECAYMFVWRSEVNAETFLSHSFLRQGLSLNQSSAI